MKKLQIFESVFPKQTVSVETVAGEYFGTGDDLQSLNIANTWSIVVVNRTDDAATDQYFTNINPASANAIRFKFESTNDIVEIRLRDSANSQFKDLQWANQLPAGVFKQFVVTWDGTDVKLYQNSVVQVVSGAFQDDAGTMTDTARKIHLGSFTNGTAQWLGNQMYFAIFDYTLGQSDIDTVYNSGDVGEVDLNALTTGPVHWWRLGLDSADIGKDYGSATAIDVMDNSVNITSADIESEFMSS